MMASKIEAQKHRSRAWYRVNETRKLVGGTKIGTQTTGVLTKVGT